jgi:Lar family restriction alleviation protein
MSEHHHTSAATIAPLLPCPFCGGQASLCDTGVTWLMCDDCQAEGPVAEAEREAVEKWNGRSGGAAQAPLSEAERHAIAHARYQVEHASPDNPDCHFDYELVLNLLHVIERSAQPPAAPVERSAPAAPTGDTRSGERPPASAAMGHRAGADTRCSAANVEVLIERLVQAAAEYENNCDKLAAKPIRVELEKTKQAIRDAVAAPKARGNYEDRHPTDDILWSASEHKDFIEVVEVLGLQESDQTPADAVRELQAEIERLNALPQTPSAPSAATEQEITSIVSRLRNFAIWNNRQSHYEPVPLCNEAADLIERISAPSLAQRIEAEARRYAEMYPQSSDGRNTFVMFADWVAGLALSRPQLDAGSAPLPSHQSSTQGE